MGEEKKIIGICDTGKHILPENIGFPIVPPPKDTTIVEEIIKHTSGKTIAIVGANHLTGREAFEMANRLKEIKPDVLVMGNKEEVEDFDFSQINHEELVLPYINVLRNLNVDELPNLINKTPNKLKMLRELNLSPEQKDYFLNAPPQRLDGEKQEDYKTRRMLNKLLIKYRGQY